MKDLKVIYQVTEVFSDGWNLSHSWLAISAKSIYFDSYEEAVKYRDENEDEFSKFTLNKLFISQKD